VGFHVEGLLAIVRQVEAELRAVDRYLVVAENEREEGLRAGVLTSLERRSPIRRGCVLGQRVLWQRSL
jgi:hypothetical protein